MVFFEAVEEGVGKYSERSMSVPGVRSGFCGEGAADLVFLRAVWGEAGFLCGWVSKTGICCEARRSGCGVDELGRWLRRSHRCGYLLLRASKVSGVLLTSPSFQSSKL